MDQRVKGGNAGLEESNRQGDRGFSFRVKARTEVSIIP